MGHNNQQKPPRPTFLIVPMIFLFSLFSLLSHSVSHQLDNEARKEVVETIQFKLQYHKDKKRAEQVKQIRGW